MLDLSRIKFAVSLGIMRPEHKATSAFGKQVPSIHRLRHPKTTAYKTMSNRDHRRGRQKVAIRRSSTGAEENKPHTAQEEEAIDQEIAVESGNLITRVVMLLLVISAGVWAYWPSLHEMVTAWEHEPDYSHGYLVIPLALAFLWIKRDLVPPLGKCDWWLGALLLVLAVGGRIFAGRVSNSALDGWSIMFWIAGSVALLFGREILMWSWSSVAFLFFMVPLPYRFETMLSNPLQRIATQLSCWGLQLLGQPALAEGNVILLGEHKLEVEQACSGLRLFVSILALAFAYMILTRRTWWENLVLLLGVIPIAIVSNALRIICTGLLFQYVSSEAAKHFSHDLAGWAMVPIAAFLFAVSLWYINQIFPEREQLEMGSLVRREPLKSHAS